MKTKVLVKQSPIPISSEMHEERSLQLIFLVLLI